MLSVIAHTTAEELRRELTEIEAANGFANRFLWVLSRRSKLLPRGGRVDEHELSAIGEDIRQAERFAKGRDDPLELDREAWTLWDSQYERLTSVQPGLTGSILARGAPHVLRLSLIYAVLDCSAVIRVRHLRAAFAVWRYCERSVRLIFGTATGYPDADRALEFIRGAGKGGRTKTEVRDLFDRNKPTEPMLEFLQRHSLAHPVERATGGRPAEVWIASEYDINDINDESGPR